MKTIGLIVVCFFAIPAQAEIITEYPHLQKYLFAEPDSNIRFGVGLSPVRMMKNKAGLTISIFQVHWSNSVIDWELFNASWGTTVSGAANSKVDSFTFRTAPKYRISRTISVGAVAGWEFVSFPEVMSKLYKGKDATPQFEPFSSRGFIFGAVASQAFKLGEKFTFKMNQIVYKQNYDTTGTSNGWQYLYSDNALNADSTPIGPGAVIVLEFSFLY